MMFFLLKTTEHDRFVASSLFAVEKAEALAELIEKKWPQSNAIVSKKEAVISHEDREGGWMVQVKELDPQDLKRLFLKMIEAVNFDSPEDLTGLANHLYGRMEGKGRKKMDPLFLYDKE